MRLERETKVFQETDTVVRLFDFDKMRVLVSDPIKKMCLKKKITDVSPVSMVPREHDQIVISDAMQSLWAHPQARNPSRAANDDDYEWLYEN